MKQWLRIWLVAGLAWAASFGLPAWAQRAADTPATAPSSTPERAFAKRITGYLKTRDGTVLRYSALLPRASGRFPVIVNYNGYDPGALGGPAYLRGNTTNSVSLDRALLADGYAVVGVNSRGTGCSEGVFDFLGASYGRDGADAVEFFAAQPWSNGAVGMANWSWTGMSQIATAEEAPPHLKAIAPGEVLADARLDSWFPGGVTAPGFVSPNWWNVLNKRWDAVRESALAEQDSRCLAQLARNRETSEAHSPANIMIQHPLRDAFIEQRDLAARADRIKVPVLSLEAFQDEAVTSRGAYYQERLDPDKVWIVQSNGPHHLYESLSFRPTLLAFLDHFVKGVDNGFEKTPRVQAWMETASTGTTGHSYDENTKPRYVISENSFPVHVGYLSFLLGPDGQLRASGSTVTGSDRYSYPAASPTVDTDNAHDAWGPMAAKWQSGTLAYTSAPLSDAVVAYGPASADLWISSTVSDTDLQVTITEVRPDHQEVFVQRSWLRLSDRAVDEGKATPVRAPLLDRPETTRALVPGQPVLARVEINKFAYAFRKGSRIRIWIDTPSDTGKYRFDAVNLPAINTIYHDRIHASKLVLGVLNDVVPPQNAAACGTMIKEPCRIDPVDPSGQLGLAE